MSRARGPYPTGPAPDRSPDVISGDLNRRRVLVEQLDLRLVGHLYLLSAGSAFVQRYVLEPAPLLLQHMAAMRAGAAENDVGEMARQRDMQTPCASPAEITTVANAAS